MRPALGYGSYVWDPQGVVLQEELESVQMRAARVVTGSYNFETGSMTGILGKLKWESLKKKTHIVLQDQKIKLVYQQMTSSPLFQEWNFGNHHSIPFQTPTAGQGIYMGSFFPQTIRDLNAHKESITSAAIVLLSYLLW